MPISLPVVGSTAHSSGAATTVTSIVISVAVLVFILYRQVQIRRAAPNMVLPLGSASQPCLAVSQILSPGYRASSSSIAAMILPMSALVRL